MPSSTNDVHLLFVNSLESQGDNLFCLPILNMLKQSLESNAPTESGEIRQPKHVAADSPYESNVSSEFILKINENGLILEIPWSDEMIDPVIKGAVELLRNIGRMPFQVDLECIQKLSKQRNKLSGVAINPFMRGYFRLRERFSSTGRLKTISTYCVKMVFLYSAISRRTSQVFIWKTNRRQSK